MNEQKGDDSGGDRGPLLALVDRQRILLSLAECGASEELVRDVRVLLEGRGSVERKSRMVGNPQVKSLNKKESQEYLNVTRYIFEKLISDGVIPEGQETAVGIRWSSADLDWAKESGYGRPQ